jgi:ribosomal protein S9
MNMDKKTRKKVDALLLKAKQCEDHKIKVTLKSGGVSSLAQVIKTQEQAHVFMTILKSL